MPCSYGGDRSSIARIVLAIAVISGAACEAESATSRDVRGVRASIVDGELAPDDDSIVVVSHVEMGELCSGTLVSKRVVVTAKHCTVGATPDGIAVGFGDTVADARALTVYSREHRETPGTVIDGQDVAVVILREDAPVPALPFSRDENVRALLGRTVRVIGFGLDENEAIGVRRTTEDVVTETGGAEFGTRGPSGCQGDSGGAALDETGTLVGVVARGREGCREDVIFGAIAYWRDLVDEAIAASGECVGAVETCNGIDDDCDMEVDEGCVAFGEMCTSDDECTSGTCRETGAGAICTMACDVARPNAECPEGFHCAGDACEGSCVPGAPGEGRNGDACVRDADCASSRCRALSPSASPTCVDACEVGRGSCVAGGVCAPASGSTCGSCVDAEVGPTPRELGEPCDRASDCASAMCEQGECARACADGDACPVGFGCRTIATGERACVRRVPERVGSPCAVDDDCASELCGVLDGRAFCSALCDEDAPCPEGTTCAPAEEDLQACVPERSLIGAACTTDDECLEGACAHIGSRGVCTRPCAAESPCPVGLSCVPAADGTPICLPPGSLREEPDCGCSVPGRPKGSLCVLGVLLCVASALLTPRARRRRR